MGVCEPSVVRATVLIRQVSGHAELGPKRDSQAMPRT